MKKRCHITLCKSKTCATCTYCLSRLLQLLTHARPSQFPAFAAINMIFSTVNIKITKLKLNKPKNIIIVNWIEILIGIWNLFIIKKNLSSSEIAFLIKSLTKNYFGVGIKNFILQKYGKLFQFHVAFFLHK